MHLRFFPAFIDRPTRITFEEQEPNEVIELFLRQHWVTNIGWILGALIAFFFPVLLIQLDAFLGLQIFLNAPTNVIFEGLILWYLLVIAFVMEKFLYWYFNIYIITSINLVDINFNSLMSRSITEVKYKDVQGVTAKVRGVFGPLFNYGDVIVDTASKNQTITFINVPKPDFVADRIGDIKHANEGGKV